jgi:phage terminase large subunit-like protein
LNAEKFRQQLEALVHSWLVCAHDCQLVPIDLHARTLLLLGGRGAGKTRTGAEWVNAAVRGIAPYFAVGEKHRRIALVGESFADVREVMIDGPSGICSLDRRRFEPPRFEAGRRRLVWPNGAVAQMFSSEDPESLRGPQFEAAWCDEVGKWKNAEATFDMLQFGLRLGRQPRQIITTTPRPTPLMRRLLADPDMVLLRMRSGDNADNLARGFLAAMEARYGRSRLGRQELEGELVEDREDALWSRDQVEKAFLATPPAAEELRRIVVAVDPPASARKTSDACGIVAAALDENGRVVVLADESLRAAKPLDWAGRAVTLYHRLKADCLLAEVNQGGDMVAAVIRGVDPNIAVKAVRAQRGKWLRAEPVAAAYQQKRVFHAGRFAELEDELCDFGPNGLSSGRSPDRLDALVWAVTELLPRWGAEPRIRDFN